jgi:peptidoglycan hydrolase-like protein with peptidoglycan-binding domain
MLAQLGYEPGPADGLLGPSTTYAIRDFQDSNGYRVDGRITTGLMRQLEDEVQDVTAWAAPPAARPSARPMARPSVDISGTWYDDQGNPLQIQQAGGALQIYAVNPLLGTPYLIAEGGIQGGTIAVNYRNSAGVSGSVRGDLAPDGRHINGTDVESTTGYTVTSTWHRGHLPGR